MDQHNAILFVVTTINIFALAAMGIDKMLAIKGKRRIPENTLLLIALLGGGVGFTLSMVIFRHKLSKVRFRIIAAVSVVFYWIVIFAYIYTSGAIFKFY